MQTSSEDSATMPTPSFPISPEYSMSTTSPRMPLSKLNSIPTQSELIVPKVERNFLKQIATKKDRVEKPAQKKRERPRTRSKLAKTLLQPLSEIMRDIDEPLVDIEAYVNRDVATRRQEVEMGKHPGKVKRPMNAFMLYRKAFQNRAKKWATRQNHQVVSQVCGDSWPLEPAYIKEQFAKWAKIERDNHQKAHPGYKFTPTKHRNTKGKCIEDSDDGSDFGDVEWQGSSKMRSMACIATAYQDSQYQSPYEDSTHFGQLSSDVHETRTYQRSQTPCQHQISRPIGWYGHPTALHMNTMYTLQPYTPLEQMPKNVHFRLKEFSAYHKEDQQVYLDSNTFASDGYYHRPSIPLPSQQQQQRIQGLEDEIDPSLIGTNDFSSNCAFNTLEPPLCAWINKIDKPIANDSGCYDKANDHALEDQHTAFLRGNDENWQVETIGPDRFENIWTESRGGTHVT